MYIVSGSDAKQTPATTDWKEVGEHYTANDIT
jgi:hypothetical protein